MMPLALAARRFRTPTPAAVLLATALLAALLPLAGCGGGGSAEPPPPVDVLAPAAVADLYVRAVTATKATLTWTAPGDDGTSGRATAYELRWATSRITPSSWDAATVAPAQAPAAAGARETVEVEGLPTGVTCWFALRAVDEEGHWAALSNVRGAVPADQGGRVWLLRPDGTGDAPTVQAAIDSARAGDLVLLADGVYTWENQGTASLPTAFMGMMVFFEEKRDFTVRSESGPAATIIDCQRQGRAMVFQGDLDTPTITIEGLTVRNGRAEEQMHWAGGAIIAHVSAIVVRDCVFEDCEAVEPAGAAFIGSGGAIYYGGVSAPTFENVIIRRCRATMGGGMFLINSSGHTVIRNCVITDNEARANEVGYGHGGGVYVNNFRFTMEDCLVANNTISGALARGGGICVEDYALPAHEMRIVRTTVADNAAPMGRAAGIQVYFYASLSLESSIVAYSRNGTALVVDPTASLAVSCTDLWGNDSGNALPAGAVDAGDNFAADPLFCSRAAPRDYGLQADSPCLPGQHPGGGACGRIGAREAGCGVPARR